MMHYGVIYRLTSPSLKVYIGATTDFDKRMAHYYHSNCRSQPRLFLALTKYGFDNFTKEIIGVAYSKAELDQLEIDAIKEHKATNRAYGYNCMSGGSNGIPGSETRARMSYSARHKPPTKPETRIKQSAKRVGGLNGRARPVICITTSTTYNYTREAAKATGAGYSDIARCCTGKRPYAGKLPDGTKLQWRYPNAIQRI